MLVDGLLLGFNLSQCAEQHRAAVHKLLHVNMMSA
jgi:hypothetical protein